MTVYDIRSTLFGIPAASPASLNSPWISPAGARAWAASPASLLLGQSCLPAPALEHLHSNTYPTASPSTLLSGSRLPVPASEPAYRAPCLPPVYLISLTCQCMRPRRLFYHYSGHMHFSSKSTTAWRGSTVPVEGLVLNIVESAQYELWRVTCYSSCGVFLCALGKYYHWVPQCGALIIFHLHVSQLVFAYRI